MKVTVNLKVDMEQNDLRRRLRYTWREVIVAGLTVLAGQESVSKPVIDSTIEEDLKQAVLYLQSAWKSIKAIR